MYLGAAGRFTQQSACTTNEALPSYETKARRLHLLFDKGTMGIGVFCEQRCRSEFVHTRRVSIQEQGHRNQLCHGRSPSDPFGSRALQKFHYVISEISRDWIILSGRPRNTERGSRMIGKMCQSRAEKVFEMHGRELASRLLPSQRGLLYGIEERHSGLSYRRAARQNLNPRSSTGRWRTSRSTQRWPRRSYAPRRGRRRTRPRRKNSCAPNTPRTSCTPGSRPKRAVWATGPT